jgi:hypothetical protein
MAPTLYDLRPALFFGGLCLLVALNGWPKPLAAQQHYVPLKQGDYRIVHEDISFHPGAKISGYYSATGYFRRDDYLIGSDYDSEILQDVNLRFVSKINTHLSLQASIGNAAASVKRQETGYVTDDDQEKGSGGDDSGLQVLFREMFLEYNHNPNAQLRIGKQDIRIGDRRGLIYQGPSTAIGQGCRIGTWCYYVGGARIGEEGGSGLFWAQLDYPVYESGVLLPDLWTSSGNRQQIAFNIEIFRIMYRGKDIPLAEYGGWTGRGSVYHTKTAAGQPIYFHNDGVEYIGLDLRWRYHDFWLDLIWSHLSGSREYVTAASDQTPGETISDTRLSGNAYHLDLTYRLRQDWKTGFRIFSASGTEAKDDGKALWEKDTTTYYEVRKGTYGEALIYFNGVNGVGDGHSVANLTYYAVNASYRSPRQNLGFDMAIFSFFRTEPVFIHQPGETPAKSRDIGLEVDFSAFWKLEQNLTFQTDVALFVANDAYTPNDNLRPDDRMDGFSQFGVGLRYDF